MKKRKQIGLYVLLFSAVLLNSCNKEKHYSNKLIKGENWQVSEIKAGDSVIYSGGNWTVYGDNIYETVSEVHWNEGNTNATNFQWQFSCEKDAEGINKRMTWILNNLCDCENESSGSDLDALDYLANDIAGTYEVITHKRKEMLFRSSETRSYKGKQVEIHLKRD